MRSPQLICAAAILALALAACGAATAAGPRSDSARAGASDRSGDAPTSAPARTGRCPTKPPARLAANRWVAARAKLAPAGAGAIRLCRYSGLNSRPSLRLMRSVLVGRSATVTSLTRALDRLAPFSGVMACPVDDESQILALLAYPSGHRVTIDVHLKGCNQVTNGDIARAALGRPGQPGPKLIARLERLTS